MYAAGDYIFYKRKDSNERHDPGTVISQENKQIVKHGGTYHIVIYKKLIK